jgi:hypothetical protein
MLRPLVVWAVCALAPAAAAAHEFWLDFDRGRVETGDVVSVDLKVGQRLRGTSWPYLTQRFTDFFWIVGQEYFVAAGRDGDIPALALPTDRPGLHAVVHQTTPFLVTYSDWATFEATLEEEGYLALVADHRARGLPEAGFTERYTRHAKGLVQVGPVREGDADLLVGMRYEAVAETNPYAEGATEVVVRLYREKQPLAGRRVTLFRDDGAVTLTHADTDAEGRVRLPISPGAAYLVSSVVMEPVDDGTAVWQSHWASLSFRLP